MTEDEAKTKWCPMVHIRAQVMYADGPDGDATKRRIESAEAEHRKTMCLGSQCMMWREYGLEFIGYDDSWKPILKSQGGGYCGLAHKP